jgi:dihydrodipicolinate synthase/N-acetylneuraminate lyase
MAQSSIRERLLEGCMIPAHPLALNSRRLLDERRQRALTRYYLDAGATGLAVGVHTTQFEIHDPAVGLYKPVLELASRTVTEWSDRACPIRVAGICGDTAQAAGEAATARDLGYDVGLVSLAALGEVSTEELVAHISVVAETIPVFGFYLQPLVGGRVLEQRFWERIFEIENVVAVKVAPFDRYHSMDVIRALLSVGRERDIALYTGNDDSIIVDLLTRFQIGVGSSGVVFAGGLLGHWAVWTKSAVDYFQRCRACRGLGSIPSDILDLSSQVTDANQAFFDPDHDFAGCLPGLHEVLRRQGLLEGRWCLNPNEELSPGQMERIDAVYRLYPFLNDDQFVAENLNRWLS